MRPGWACAEVVLAIHHVRAALLIVLTINALSALKIAIVVPMNSAKITPAWGRKPSVSATKTALVMHLFALKVVVSNATLIAIVRMGKLVVITGVREGKRMNAVTMPIAQLVNNALIGAVSTILMPVPLIKIVRRISAAKVVAV